jgi:hypothetical protein
MKEELQMDLCALLDSAYGWLGQSGVGEIPWLGDMLLALLDWLWDLLGCAI